VRLFADSSAFAKRYILENHSLRAMDSLHIACAVEWKADLFVTADKRQWIAAKQSGLRAEYIGKLS